MATCKMTIYGFIKYMDDIGDDLFGTLTLPTGLNKATLEDAIILRGGEFEVFYANPFFMKEAIGKWGSKWYDSFDKWYTAFHQTYSPIENYDRNEYWKDESEGSNDTTSEGKVSAYDVSTYSPLDKSEGGTEFESSTEHRARIHGNIGVTTNQQMIQAEIDLYKNNLYEMITDVFLQEFAIPVY